MNRIARSARHILTNRERLLPLLRTRGLSELRAAAAARGLLRGENERRLAAFRDRHAGRRAFFIGTGPSLTIADLEALRGELTFSCNRITLAFAETDWRPDYYCISDLLVGEQMASEVGDLTMPCFFRAELREHLGPDAGVYLHNRIKVGPEARFSKDLLRGYYGINTVIGALLQLGWFMGVREAYLLGVDFSYAAADAGPSEEERTALRAKGIDTSRVTQATGGEQNHFMPGYQAAGQTWVKPAYEVMREGFAAARLAFESEGGLLANASRRTKLDVLPRVDLDELLRS